MNASKIKKIIISLPLLTTILTAAVAAPLVVGVQQQDAYAQGLTFYDRIDEDLQALVSQELNELQNQTVEHVALSPDGGLVILWTKNITATTPEGTAIDIRQDTRLSATHEFTPANGYVYRDGSIFAPNGTELFTE